MNVMPLKNNAFWCISTATNNTNIVTLRSPDARALLSLYAPFSIISEAGTASPPMKKIQKTLTALFQKVKESDNNF
jgi:hypothetical protein